MTAAIDPHELPDGTEVQLVDDYPDDGAGDRDTGTITDSTEYVGGLRLYEVTVTKTVWLTEEEIHAVKAADGTWQEIES